MPNTGRSRFQQPFANNFGRSLIQSVCSLALVAFVAGQPVAAQDEAIIDQLATILAAEDARRFDIAVFRSAVSHPDAIVRKYAALAMGRIGEDAALPLLIQLSSDRDSSIQANAVFAIGLLASTDGLPRLRELVSTTQVNQVREVQEEAAAAIAMINGSEGASLIRDLLRRWVGLIGRDEMPRHVVRALGESWRLGDDAPIDLLVQYADSRNGEARWRALYSLGRLGAPDAVNVMLRATSDPNALVRSIAARALSASLADRAGVDPRAFAARVEQLVRDPDSRVRVNALRSLATYDTVDHVGTIADRVADPDPNVRVEALTTLGAVGGDGAVQTLRILVSGGIFATRFQALMGLARSAGSDATAVIQEWQADPSWRTRAAAAQAFGIVGMEARPYLQAMLSDTDPRVVAPALRAILGMSGLQADSLARMFVRHDDAVLRLAALNHLGRERSDHIDVPLFVEAYERAVEEHNTTIQIAVVRTFGRGITQDDETQRAIERRFLDRFQSNENYLVRRAAEEHFPRLAGVWGGERPVRTGRGIEDYRDLVRELLLPAERRGERPAFVIETDRGEMTFELLPGIAPLTVRAFLELVDRRYFDGSSWHRVVPNFVIQDGDARGDGSGNAGFALRDEVSRERYARGTLGLARSGPDTGSSQFFITHSVQPHLEAAYTVFGRLRDGGDVLDRVTLGDRIRRIRRIGP